MRLGVQGTPPNPPPQKRGFWGGGKGFHSSQFEQGMLRKIFRKHPNLRSFDVTKFFGNLLTKNACERIGYKKITKHSSMNSHPLVWNSNFHPIPLLLFPRHLRRDQLRLLLLHILRVSGLSPALIPKHRRLRCTQPSVNSRPCWFLYVYWAGQCWRASQRLLWIAGVTVR